MQTISTYVICRMDILCRIKMLMSLTTACTESLAGSYYEDKEFDF